MIDLAQIKSHLFGREYMSGVERDQTRIKSTGEVFTPAAAVNKMLDMIPLDFFADPTKLAGDPACGDGNWLVEVLWRKLNNNIDFIGFFLEYYLHLRIIKHFIIFAICCRPQSTLFSSIMLLYSYSFKKIFP